MFLYIKVHLGQNPDFKALKDASQEEPDEKWTREFWQELIQEKVITYSILSQVDELIKIR